MNNKVNEMKIIISIILVLVFSIPAYATTALYRISSGEVHNIEAIDDSHSDLVATGFWGVLTDPPFTNGTVCRDPSGELRVFNFAKINDSGTVRNATQIEIDGFAAHRENDRKQAQANKALAKLLNDPIIRMLLKAQAKAFIEYEFNKTRALFRVMFEQIALSTTLANFQTRMAAVAAAHPMPDRSLPQLWTIIQDEISPND